MTGASIEPFSLTPAEWLVVFPRPARPPTGVAGVFAHTLWSADDGPADPDEDGLKSDDVEAGIVSSSVSDRASKLREQYPVDRNALEATIKALDATGLRVLVRAVDDLDPIVGPTSLFPVFIAGVMNLSVIGSICVIWGLNDGSFESRQLVGGLVAVILTSFSSFSSESMAAVVQRGSLSDAGSLFRATLEQLVRWQQFGELLEHSSSSSRLLEHVTNDDQCPCKRCLRDLPTRIFWERLLKSVLLPSYSVFCVFTVGWTALVRYGAVFWARCWGVLFGIIFLGSAILCQFLVAAMRNYWFLGSIPLVSLKTRIYHRATSLALRSFLDRAKRDLRTPPPQSTDVTPPGSDLELFVELHTSYTLIWSEAHIGREGKDTYTFFSVTLMPACVVLGTVIILATGSCFVLWNLNVILLLIAFNILTISILPVTNNQITTITSLYAEAGRALDSLVAEGSWLPATAERQQVINRLSAYATLLRTLERADQLRAKFLGFPVTWGVVKTYLVTLFTLGVGLWSVVRGSGLFFTLESVCPVR